MTPKGVRGNYACSPPSTAPLSAATGNATGHEEVIRFLNTLDAQVPKRKGIHATI